MITNVHVGAQELDGSGVPGEPIRVLVADDHVLYRRGLELVPGQDPDTALLGESGHGAWARRPPLATPGVHWPGPKRGPQPAGRDFGNDRLSAKDTGLADENPTWGNGPFNDWAMPSPSTATLTRSWGWFRSNDLPVVAPGYSPTPVQV